MSTEMDGITVNGYTYGPSDRSPTVEPATNLIQPGTGLRPYQCPVCVGVGRVAAGFYARVGTNTWTTSSLQPERCRSCSGSGIVWG